MNTQNRSDNYRLAAIPPTNQKEHKMSKRQEDMATSMANATAMAVAFYRHSEDAIEVLLDGNGPAAQMHATLALGFGVMRIGCLLERVGDLLEARQ